MKGTVINVTQLTCEYASNPLGLDMKDPRFGWILEAGERGAVQSAYRILVASNREKLDADDGDKWDSGKVASDRSVNIPYEGAALTSGERCWWKVQAWLGVEGDGAWSEPATFEMGLIEQSDWQGKWIGIAAGVPSPLLRKEFPLGGAVKSARLCASGIGWSEIYLNGSKVGDHVLDPCASEYPKSTYCVVHDVTAMLQQGDNAIGAWLGNGWYCEPEFYKAYGDCPRLLVQLNITLESGETISVVSDESWKGTGSCIIMNDFWHGEIYDARLETPGWDDVGFDDAGWMCAEVKDAPGGALRAQIMPPIKVVQVRKPVRVTEPKPNVYLYDFGQLFGGWIRLRVKGPAGTKITIKYSGRAYADNTHTPDYAGTRNNSGLIDKRRHETPKGTDYYVLKGDPDGEVYEPRFTYHPMNYVQIEGSPCKLGIDSADGCVVHTDEDLSGDFECSNELFNQIHKNVVWTLTNGLFGMPLDCLFREHWAWTDPATITGSLYARKFMPRFWTKWLRDIADSQRKDGAVPHLSPLYHDFSFDAAWGGNYAPLVWYLYQYYADDQMLAAHYDGMKACVDYMTSVAKEHIITEGCWGDHMLPGSEPGKEEFVSSETPRELVWTGYYYRAALVVSQAAGVLGKTDDVDSYADVARTIKEAFNTKWLDTEAHRYVDGSQTANIYPLALDIVDDADRQGVLDTVVESITKQYDYHHHAGNTGTTCLIDKLTELGHGDLLNRVVNQTTYPGWGFMVAEGATTIWESWSLLAGCGNAESMIMWATIDEFFYNDLAGIRGPDYYGPGRMEPGFKHIRIAPLVPDDMDSASAYIRTVHGTVASSWRRTDSGIALDVTIPVSCTGAISVPKVGLSNVSVTEGGTTAWKDGADADGAEGITGAAETDDSVTFEVGSGVYCFALSGQ